MKIKISIATIVLVSLAACGGGDEEKAVGPETGIATAAAKSAAGTIASQVTGFGVSTADLPDFAEIIPGGKVIHNMKIDTAEKLGGSVSLTSDKKPDEIVAFYKASLAKHGLKIQVENAGGQMVQMMAESEDKARSLAVMVIIDDEGNKSVNLVHSRPKV
jgi:hypothetical protein